MVASPPGTERDVVLIRGIEPSMRWRTFCEQILELCHSLEVTRIVLLGALLADVPYTRPLPISGSASDKDGRRAVQAHPDPVRGPDRHRRRAAGRLPTAPSSTRCRSGCTCRTTPTTRPARRRRWRCCTGSRRSSTCPCRWPTWPRSPPSGRSACSAAAEQDAELAEYVRELEERAGDEGIQPLTGDEIASEFEKYLRRRGGSAGPTAGSW